MTFKSLRIAFICYSILSLAACSSSDSGGGNSLPELLKSDPVQTVQEDEIYLIQVKDDDGDSIDVSFDPQLDWIVFDSNTNSVSISPENRHVGSHEVKITLDDGFIRISKTITIVVENVNDAPELGNILEAAYGTEVNSSGVDLALQIDDVDSTNFELVFPAAPALANVSYSDSNQTLTLTPNGATGSETISFQVKDSEGAISAQSYSFSFSVDAVALTKTSNNQSAENAQQHFQNSTINNTATAVLTEDWYRFDAFADGAVELLISGLSGNALDYFNIEVLSSSQAPLSNSYSLEGGKLLFPVESGLSYLIQLTPTDSYGSEPRDYTLMLEYYPSQPVKLSWTAPITFEDGSTLNPTEDLSAYSVYMGDSAESISQNISSISDPATSSSIIYNLRFAQQYHFTMTAITTTGIESVPSDSIIFTLQ